ncbi:hypothetical protein [Falsibacillus pallidus]|uniref:Uncharacterized protein n=1 Tax=Falsibacillus pallidus TaxID=493781 RepID=A0A370GK93_9BACI|nr:hypothetical protein [Falsibacillus pallidus]RDI44067.1 hypothetical protein DFR59_103130 [Falsibacillus pallidus]
MSNSIKKLEKINTDSTVENKRKKKLKNGETVYFATLKRNKPAAFGK